MAIKIDIFDSWQGVREAAVLCTFVHEQQTSQHNAVMGEKGHF